MVDEAHYTRLSPQTSRTPLSLVTAGDSWASRRENETKMRALSVF
jgi:hypothetical protein